jgi:hypothetical protein
LLFFLHAHAFLPLIICGIFVIIYPYSKRFFCVPQLFLGISYSFGFVIAICHELNVPFYLLNFNVYLFQIALICWIVFFDTIYAKRDIVQDAFHNVYSATIFFENHPRKLSMAFVVCATLASLNRTDAIFILPLLPIVIGLFFTKKFSNAKINSVLLNLLFLEITLFSFFVQNFHHSVLMSITVIVQVISVFQKPSTGFKLNTVAMLPMLFLV